MQLPQFFIFHFSLVNGYVFFIFHSSLVFSNTDTRSGRVKSFPPLAGFSQVDPGAVGATAPPPSICASDCHDGAAHPAQFFCLECGEDYCQQEATLHRRSKALRTHTLVPVAEKGRVVSTMCPVHPDEKLKSCCSACAIPICVLCVAETHTAGTLVNPDGPADGPKHKAISLDQAGRAADASLQQIHATVSGLATTYGASVSAVQVCSSQVDSQPSRLSTIFFFFYLPDRPLCAMSVATETRP